MLWKIIVIVAAFFLFRRARRRRPALTCLKLWRKTLYRRHKPVEAELLRVEEKDGTNLLVCDVPSLQKHALISVDRKRAQQFRRYLASLEAKNGEGARPGIRLEQYKVDGDTFLLTVQSEPKQAVYLPSAQREREAQQKCKKAWETGIVLLAAGAVSGLASASVGAALVAAGGAALALNQPFADVSVWKEQCCLKPRPVEELPADAENEYPEDYSQSATDISMDPAASYQAITGIEKQDATEAECFTELFRAMMKRCAAACSSGFRYVESPLVKAIRNGWLCEIQEPSLIQRPAVMPGLNGLLDETGCIVLPTGEMLHRHPDCVIVSTLNVDLEGCRPLNQAFLDRHHIVMDMVCPNDKIIEERIKKMTGCDDTINLMAMIDTMRQIAKVAASRGATDGNTNSMRQLASWVEAVMVTGDYKASAEWTIISGTTADPEVRAELTTVVKNRAF